MRRLLPFALAPLLACSDDFPNDYGSPFPPPYEPDIEPAAPAAIVPVLYAAADTPPGISLERFDAIWKATAARFTAQTGFVLPLEDAILYESTKRCADLGQSKEEVFDSVAEELEPLTEGGARKLQILLPCVNPSEDASGWAWIPGAIAVTYAPDDPISGEPRKPSGAYISEIGMHELGHNLGLPHNSVGENCMGSWELASASESQLGSDAISRCVLLPHQRSKLEEWSGPWLTLAKGQAPFEAGPRPVVLPLPLSPYREIYEFEPAPASTTAVTLRWTSAAPPGVAGTNVYRDDVRIGFVPRGADPRYLDEDGEAEYHEDPEMDDAGLREGRRYCYSLAHVDASGAEGPKGPETCVRTLPR